MVKRLRRVLDEELPAFTINPTYEQACLLRDEACWRFQELIDNPQRTFPPDLARWLAVQIRSWLDLPPQYANWIIERWPDPVSDNKVLGVLPDPTPGQRIELLREAAFRLEFGRRFPQEYLAWMADEIEDLTIEKPREGARERQLRDFRAAVYRWTLMRQRKGKRRKGNLPDTAEEVAEAVGSSRTQVKKAYNQFEEDILLLNSFGIEIPEDLPSKEEATRLLKVVDELRLHERLSSAYRGFDFSTLNRLEL